MTQPLPWIQPDERRFEVRQPDGRLLFSYIVNPDTPARESPRPYLHPLHTLDGDGLSNLRPNDHPWHHALSLTLTSVAGVNFWGGPSFRAGEGYQWRDDHGAQVQVEWRTTDEGLDQVIEWRAPGGEVLLREDRMLRPRLLDEGWSLGWESQLHNVAGRDLICHNYHSGGGLAGSHYSGLQFRGARGLLDDHGDPTITLTSEGGAAGEAAVHGLVSPWLEWHAQHDTSLRRTRMRFESLGEPVHWFVRRQLPLVVLSPHTDQPLILGAASTLALKYRLSFLRA
jgi:hypothetical protein